MKLAVLAGSLVLAAIVLTTSLMPALERPTFGAGAPTPDTGIVPVTRDSVLMQCQSPDDCRFPNLHVIPAGSLVRVVDKARNYVVVIEPVNLRGIEGVLR